MLEASNGQSRCERIVPPVKTDRIRETIYGLGGLIIDAICDIVPARENGCRIMPLDLSHLFLSRLVIIVTTASTNIKLYIVYYTYITTVPVPDYNHIPHSQQWVSTFLVGVNNNSGIFLTLTHTLSLPL